jgi:hypothetical protein
VPGGHQKYFGKTQQSKLVKTRRDSAEVHAECKSMHVCSLMEKIRPTTQHDHMALMIRR